MFTFVELQVFLEVHSVKDFLRAAALVIVNEALKMQDQDFGQVFERQLAMGVNQFLRIRTRVPVDRLLVHKAAQRLLH